MQNLSQRKARNFEAFQSADDVFAVLKSQFSNRKLYIKYSVDKFEVTINEYNADKTVMLVTDPTFEKEDSITVYGLSDKYIEIDFSLIEMIGPGYFKCKIKSARRAVGGRRDLRFKLNPDDAVATNFKISKQKIDVTTYNIPTSIKVLLDQFKNTNSKLGDIVNVDVFPMEEQNSLLKLIKKSSKTLFVSNTADPESYKALNDDFIDLYELYGNKLNDYIKKNIEKGYKSIVIVPIIYVNEEEKSIPFAYIQVVSKSTTFTLDKVLDLKVMSFKLIDRIRDANTELISIHQQIIDVSRGGAKIKFTDKRLKEYVQKSKGFVYDLVFKLQAPITLFGDVKATYKDDNGDVYVGVDFEGNSSRKNEMKRFYAILKPMEADYKSRLIKNMKQQQK